VDRAEVPVEEQPGAYLVVGHQASEEVGTIGDLQGEVIGVDQGAGIAITTSVGDESPSD